MSVSLTEKAKIVCKSLVRRELKVAEDNLAGAKERRIGNPGLKNEQGQRIEEIINQYEARRLELLVTLSELESAW